MTPVTPAKGEETNRALQRGSSSISRADGTKHGLADSLSSSECPEPSAKVWCQQPVVP